MNLISYALSKKGIINVDGKQYKPELKDGEIVYKKIEKPGEYTTFTFMGSTADMLVMANNAPNSITELYINDVPQELPTLSLVELMGGDTDNKHFTILKPKEGDIIKIKGGFSLTANNGDLSGVFEGNNEFNISNIILQNDLEDCSWMFTMCASLTEVPVIPSSVTDCSFMFTGTSITEAPVIPNSVTNCNNMFCGCTTLTEAPVIPNGVTDCSYMFDECISLTEAPVIPSSVTNCECMFLNCSSLTTLPSENVDLMYNHNDELKHSICYLNCTKIIDPISYDEIPDDWR